MLETLRRPAKGFWGRSYDELKRLSGIAARFEGVKGPSGPLELQSFGDASSVADCKLMTDDEIGGYSTAHIDWAPSSSAAPSTPGYIRFHGNISTRLPPNRPDVHRSGYAAWRTADRQPTIFGHSLWDVDSYAYLAMRIRSDGRSYLINVQTDSMVAPTDLHQHRLFSRRPGKWETVIVPWADFVRTNHGFVVEPQTELLRRRVQSVGLGLTDRVPGPFELCISRLWATNNPHDVQEVEGYEEETEDAALSSTPPPPSSEAPGSSSADGTTVNIPFEQPPSSSTSPSSPAPATPKASAKSSSVPPPKSSGLKDKHGHPVRWDSTSA